MWQVILGLVLVWVLSVPATLGAEVAVEELAVAAPWMEEADRTAARFLDLGDGTWLFVGSRATKRHSCAPAETTFVARRQPDGAEIWRSQLPPAALSRGPASPGSLDPRYVLASKVHGLAVDTGDHEIFVVSEVLLAWAGGDCAAGVATAVGTWISRFSIDGELLADTYLGTRPAGPPAGPFSCSQRCAPDRLPQLAGRSIVVQPDDTIQIAGLRRPARSALGVGREEFFVKRLARDLGQPMAPSSGLAKTYPFNSGVGAEFCSISAPGGHIVSINALPNTMLAGSYANLFNSDDCVVAFTYASAPGPTTEPLYGIAAEFNVPPDARSLVFSVDLTVPTYHIGPVMMQLWDREVGDYLTVLRLHPDSAGKIVQVAHPMAEPGRYVSAEGQVSTRLVAEYDPTVSGYEESIELDKLEIEPD